jgi:hypothetical protein
MPVLPDTVGVVIAHAAKLRKVVVIQVDVESHTRTVQEIEELNARHAEDSGGFSRRQPSLCVQFERGMLLDRTDQFRFGATIDGAVGEIEFECEFHWDTTSTSV